MDNKIIAKQFKLLSQLMEIHQENPFKVKSIANASFKIDKLPFNIAEKTIEQIDAIDGIGKSISKKIEEFLKTGSIEELNTFLSITPIGIVEMLKIKGIGPKKIAVLWKDLGIDNIGELYYACNENRLIEAKGFGEKTQAEILKALEFNALNQGKNLYAKMINFEQDYFQKIEILVKQVSINCQVFTAGEFRRKCEIINQLTYVVTSGNAEKSLSLISQLSDIEIIEFNNNYILFKDLFNITVKVTVCLPNHLGKTLLEETGSDSFVKNILNQIDTHKDYASEQEIFDCINAIYIEPELREDHFSYENYEQKKLIDYNDLKGTLHNHSNWSDGINSLEEMALYCKNVLNLEYLGICDHSKSAFYANGLSIERVLQQHEEINSLNKKLFPFKIFKGIESDILNDGQLDYPDEILQKFDFVVASIHSNLKMDEEKATKRLITAIENKYTTILGHPTGRLLLSRAGYAVNFKKIIDACAANNVVIEINANPLRLDLDWRWHQYAVEKGVLLSINPDAHRIEGLHDMQFGINVARKGGLAKENCLNTFTLDAISNYFSSKKNNNAK